MSVSRITINQQKEKKKKKRKAKDNGGSKKRAKVDSRNVQKNLTTAKKKKCQNSGNTK